MHASHIMDITNTMRIPSSTDLGNIKQTKHVSLARMSSSTFCHGSTGSPSALIRGF